MEYISVAQFAGKYGISERTARKYCADGKIDGAFLTGKTWNIPSDTMLPKKGNAKLSPLLTRLREEKDSKLKGGIYHRTQIDLTYRGQSADQGTDPLYLRDQHPWHHYRDHLGG